MTPEQFAYWMRGFSELNSAPPTEEQWRLIRERLMTVFAKPMPNLVGPNTFPVLPPNFMRPYCGDRQIISFGEASAINQ